MNKKKKGLGGLFAVIAILAVLIGTTFGMIRDHLNLGLDLQGGFEILYQVTPLSEGGAMDMSAVTNSIQKRVNRPGPRSAGRGCRSGNSPADAGHDGQPDLPGCG